VNIINSDSVLPRLASLESLPNFGKVYKGVEFLLRRIGWIRGGGVVENLKDFLRISEAAEYLGVSANTLRNWENAGKIAAHRHPVNGYRLFRPDELDALLRPLSRPAKAPRKPR